MPVDPITKDTQLATIAENEQILARVNSEIEKRNYQINSVQQQIQSKDETILYWQNKLSSDPTNADYQKSINMLVDEKTSLQAYLKNLGARQDFDLNRVTQIQATITEYKNATIITESYSETTTTVTSSTTYTQTTNTTETTTTTASEESPVNEGAATRTDVDQSDPSKIPSDNFDEDVESEAVKAAKEKQQSSAKEAVAKTAPPEPAKAQWRDATDMRVTLRVPEAYLVGPCAVLKKIGGILFPYTPQVSYDNKANYTAQQPLHSNFAQYFYQRSSVGPITISGKFSNQNEKDGVIYLGVVHLLRSLIKMPWGEDPNAGSPPPVCRIDAYGDFMLNNVPVVVDSFRTEWPETVDYIAVGTTEKKLGHTMVPTVATINVTLNVVYSRQEIQNYTVQGWLNGALKGRGYL